MQAIVATGPGDAEVLQLSERPVPEPGAEEILIKVEAAGVNRPDILQRRGLYPPPPGASDILGLEVAGTVEALGPAVDRFQIGQRVCALIAGGGYAPFAIAPAGQCLPVPASMSSIEAAALPETLFTVWSNVFQRAYAREGETILVHGGTSGIGTMAISLAKAFGLDIIVTCGDDAKCERARAIGADAAINYRNEDFVAAVHGWRPRGVDVVLDMVGGDYVPRNLQCLAEDGRHVSIAVQRGAMAEINIAALMVRRVTLTGSTLRPRTIEYKSLLCQEIADTVWPIVEAGNLRPVIDRIYPLSQATAAHLRMEEGSHVGKIVLQT